MLRSYLGRKKLETKKAAFYWRIRSRNLLRRMTHPEVENTYFFILCPPFCGSTLLNELISTSPNVSTNNERSTREGQNLPGLNRIMALPSRWDEGTQYDWAMIKREWRKYWDVTKPILLEKSPPNIIRAETIQAHFSPAYFICFNRNPYAHCESLMRRSANLRDPARAARFAVRCLRYQQHNLARLDKVLHVTYEELTEYPAEATGKIERFLPALGALNPHLEFDAHNYKAKKLPITNLNTEKIGKLSREEIGQMSAVFRQHKDILDFFHYEIMSEITT